MPRAEAGSTKDVANRMKSKGLQRLRWYCQVCEKQCRDENGFKCHVMSESHTRRMLLVGQNPRAAINDFSRQFKHDFLQLLRTSHGTKMINMNHFYQQYIAHKEHVHMNATKYGSLTEFAKFLGREGICRVEEADKGLEIAWIDTSPEALRRQAANEKKERMDKTEEERERRLVEEQVARAQAMMADEEEETMAPKELTRADGEKLQFNFGRKPTSPPVPTEEQTADEASKPSNAEDSAQSKLTTGSPPLKDELKPAAKSFSLSKPASGATKNVFAAKKSQSGGAKKIVMAEAPKRISEAERIMLEDKSRKRGIGFGGAGAVGKRLKVD